MAALTWTVVWSLLIWTLLPLTISEMVFLRELRPLLPKDLHHHPEPSGTEARQPLQMNRQVTFETQGPADPMMIMQGGTLLPEPLEPLKLYRRDGLRERGTLLPLHPQAQMSVQTVTARTVYHTAGQRPVFFWKAIPLKKQWSDCTRSTDKSCRRAECRSNPKLGVWPDCAAKPTAQTGTRCKQRPGKGSQGPGWKNGVSSSILQHMRSADVGETDRAPHEQLLDFGRQATPFRPRSFRAVFFQKPCHLHPHSRPTSQKPRRRSVHQQQRASREAEPAPGESQCPTPSGLGPDSLARKSWSNHTAPTIKKGHPGPKSGTSLHRLFIIIMIQETGGVRVPLDTASGGRPAALAAGKHRGPSPPSVSATVKQHPVNTLTHSVKRAFRRARHRAHSSLNQGTWYKGRWHTVDSLGQLPQPSHQPPRRDKLRLAKCRRPTPHLQVLSWNASGLSSAMFQEFIAWCDMHADLDAIIIQETHWSDTSDFNTGP